MNDFAAIDLKSLAFLVHNTLKEHGIEAILVDGACVSIYSENRYQSYDLDFVNPPIAIGNESIRTFETLTSSSGILKLLTPTDCVKDRLAFYV